MLPKAPVQIIALYHAGAYQGVRQSSKDVDFYSVSGCFGAYTFSPGERSDGSLAERCSLTIFDPGLFSLMDQVPQKSIQKGGAVW